MEHPNANKLITERLSEGRGNPEFLRLVKRLNPWAKRQGWQVGPLGLDGRDFGLRPGRGDEEWTAITPGGNKLIVYMDGSRLGADLSQVAVYIGRIDHAGQKKAVTTDNILASGVWGDGMAGKAMEFFKRNVFEPKPRGPIPPGLHPDLR